MRFFNIQIDWQQAYTYDRYGNRRIDTDPSQTWGGVNNFAFELETGKNRLYAPGDLALAETLRRMQYDSAGNLKVDTYSAAAVTRVYDAENRMTKETQAGSYDAGIYSYDGDGRRVKRNIGGVETWQVYGLGGELLAEYAGNASYTTPQKEYGYRNGQLLITTEAATTSAPPPTALTANAPTSGANVTLNWTAASGASNYRVERKGAGESFKTGGQASDLAIL